ncbi:YdcF family protein [Pampinifervens florentissimum]|uniref:YdcF family protein n=1 Tax=Pampinifervens florentissimum TaxID=1632019 RepID=UPI0013B49EA2|nr:YdcF family protein [Hydrogenobacter sp. T-8]QID32991.1 YdcF family protein [Hydrogenobacter sp. T-8]
MSFFLKKLLSLILLPPTLFIILFLIIAVISKRRVVSLLAFFGAFGLYLLSVEPVKDMLYKPLEEAYPVPREVQADALVVLGGGSYNTGILKEDSMKRLLTGFILHKRYGLPIILSGGASIGKLPEAEVMKQVLEELGVDKKEIITEVRSRDTFENAKYVKEICKERNFKKIVLITSAYHMRRAVETFRRAGLETIPYPTDFKQDKSYNLYSFIPRMSVLNDSYKALREHLGGLAYSMLY